VRSRKKILDEQSETCQNIYSPEELSKQSKNHKTPKHTSWVRIEWFCVSCATFCVVFDFSWFDTSRSRFVKFQTKFLDKPTEICQNILALQECQDFLNHTFKSKFIDIFLIRRTFRDLSKHWQPRIILQKTQKSTNLEITYIRRKSGDICQYSAISTRFSDFLCFPPGRVVLWDLIQFFSTNNSRLVKTFTAQNNSQQSSKIRKSKNHTPQSKIKRYRVETISFVWFSTFVCFTQTGGVLWDLRKEFSTNNLGLVKKFIAAKNYQFGQHVQKCKNSHIYDMARFFDLRCYCTSSWCFAILGLEEGLYSSCSRFRNWIIFPKIERFSL